MYSISIYFILAFSLLCVSVDSYCWVGGPAPVAPGGSVPTSCSYHGWIISSNSSFKSPAPYCEECACHLGGGISCCGYGWKGGLVGIEGCKRVVDDSTCDSIFVDADDESRPCRYVERVPA